jgi:DNA-binding SARP family transcriptional activator
MGLAIHLLGAPRVECDGCAMPAPRGHKVWGLLAYLARSSAPASRKHLADLLFEDAEDPLAALRWNLSELRRLLAHPGLRGELVSLELAPGAYVDVDVVMRGGWAEALHVPGLDHELLEGMNFASSPSFEVWLATERRHLQAAAEGVLREAALARLAAGAASEAADLSARLVRRNPLDENFQALLVRSLAAAGDGIGAARQAAACRELFQRELGVLPGATLDAAVRTVTATPTARPATGRAAAIAQIDAGEAAIGAGALEAGLQCLRRAIVEADVTGRRGAANACSRGAGQRPGACLRVGARRGGRDGAARSARRGAGRLALVGRGSVPRAGLTWSSCAAATTRAAGQWLRRAMPLAGSDRAEQARIAIVCGCCAQRQTAHYGAAIAMLARGRDLCRGGRSISSRPRTRGPCLAARCCCMANVAAATEALRTDRSAWCQQG